MKKNRMMRLASVLLVCVLLTTSVISGTFAKYTSTATATDTATVAKWSITVDGDEIATKGSQPTVDIDLFKTVKEIGGDDENEVAAVEKLIAPGTQGTFDLKIANLSQVDAEYSINFVVTGAAVPLVYQVDGGAWGSSLAAITKEAIDMGVTDTVTINWRWDFEQADVAAGDLVDTGLGIDAETVIVTATITVDQVD